MNVTSEIKSYIELKETCGALLLTGKMGMRQIIYYASTGG